MATGDPWTFNVKPARADGHIYVTDGTTSVDISPLTPMGDAYSTSAFISGTSVSLEFYDDNYPDISFTPQTATVGSTTAVNFLPTVMYAWSSDNSGTYPSTLYTWTIDITADLTDIPFWANYQNGTADDVTTTIRAGSPVWTGADEFEVDGVVYTRDSSKDVVTTTQTVAHLSDGTNTYEIEDSQARADIQEIQSNYVTTDTAQTISGYKTISNDGAGNNKQMDVVCENLDLNNLPLSDAWAGIEFQDANGTRIAKVEPCIRPDGTVRTNISASQPVSGKKKYGSLAICVKPDGTAFTEAPACSNTNSIVTTTGLSKSTNGYVKLGNGIIIQWGDHNTTSPGASTITFPTAFSNNNYSITFTRISGSNTTNESGSYYFRGRTTTSVAVYKTNNSTQSMMWIAVGY